MKASLIELVRYKRTGFGKLTSCNLSIYHILSAPFIRPVTHLIVATLLLPLCWILVENEVVTAGALLYRLRLLIKLAPVSLCVKYGGCCLSDRFMMFTDLTWWSLHDTSHEKPWHSISKNKNQAATSKALVWCGPLRNIQDTIMSHES